MPAPALLYVDDGPFLYFRMRMTAARMRRVRRKMTHRVARVAMAGRESMLWFISGLDCWKPVYNDDWLGVKYCTFVSCNLSKNKRFGPGLF